MPKLMVAVVALLVSGCMTGPIPVSGNNANNGGAYPSRGSEEKLPGGPAVQNVTP